MNYEEETRVLHIAPGEAQYASIYTPYKKPAHLTGEARAQLEHGISVPETSDAVDGSLLLGTYYSVRPNQKRMVYFQNYAAPKILVNLEDPSSGSTTSGNTQLDRLAQKLLRREVQNLRRDSIFYDIPLRLVVRRTPVSVPDTVRKGNRLIGDIADEDGKIIKLNLLTIHLPHINKHGDFSWKDRHGKLQTVSDAL